MRPLVVLFMFVLGAMLFHVPPASAHQDGCHRWHSCPSDTGTYNCGDLGYSCRYDNNPGPQSGPTTTSADNSGDWLSMVLGILFWSWLAIVIFKS
jgi:hypothetical protein